MDVSPQMFRDIPSVLKHHWTRGTFDWPMIFYQTLIHGVALVGLSKLTACKPETLLWAFTLMPIGGLGVTAGAHRLWAHRSYEACLPVRIGFMLCNCLANQRSLYYWCKDHRVHHQYSETNADPHNAARGFFFAHIGWLLVHRHPDCLQAGRKINVDDLREDRVLQFQRLVDPVLPIYICFVLPAQVAARCWGEDYWTAFFVAGGLKYVLGLHFTFLVNSAAHLHGDHAYDTTAFPAENPIVSFFAFGEGWHSYHHKYPFDYATSEFGILSQYNPTKLLIDVLCWTRCLAWGRKRATDQWALAMARRDRDRANGVPLAKPLLRPWEETQSSGGDLAKSGNRNSTSEVVYETSKRSGAYFSVLSIAVLAPILWNLAILSHGSTDDEDVVVQQ